MKKEKFKVIRAILAFPFLFLIKFYRYCISPFTPASCRYFPTCSEYASESFKKHGVFKGGILTFLRLLRCQPFGSSGYDPVPDDFKILKRRNIPSKTKQGTD